MKRMAKTRDAMKIIDKMVGGDVELKQLIADARVNSQIAQMVYDARTAAGLTQKELADMVGTGQSAIARLEDADYDGHSLTMLQRIAEALNCHVELRIVTNDSVPATS
jgi:ribosome-binding protein aMBF1 (putative translation factor)